MALTLSTPSADDLPGILESIATWQVEGAPMQVHPGDLGWSGWRGQEHTATLLRTWHRDGALVALGFLDGPDLLRLALDPDLIANDPLARSIAADLADPARGVLPAGAADVEVHRDAALRPTLLTQGWRTGEEWTHLRHDLTGLGDITDLDEANTPSELRVVVAGPELAEQRTAVHRAAFGSEGFTAERWSAVAAGPAYAGARCLLGFHGEVPVAAVTVWSAGPGRPGILEPMGVHPEHRGHGFGAAISAAGAAHLRDLGASSATVGTPSANTGAVATYTGAGFRPFARIRDLRRVG